MYSNTAMVTVTMISMIQYNAMSPPLRFPRFAQHSHPRGLCCSEPLYHVMWYDIILYDILITLCYSVYTSLSLYIYIYIYMDIYIYIYIYYFTSDILCHIIFNLPVIRTYNLCEEFTRLAETRLTQNTLNYLKLA